MDPVDVFARLKAEIKRLQDRAEVLREAFLRPRAVLGDPRYWDDRESEVVTCRALDRAEDEDIVPID